MKLSEARSLVDVVIAEDLATAQLALRDTSKNYKYRMPEVLARVIFDKTADYRQYLDDASRFDIVIRLVNLAVWTNTAKNHKSALNKLVFVGLQHNSGKVRQNARMLSQNYSRFLSDDSEPIEFLHKLEKLIKKHEPQTIPLYVDTASPSVYKSLVMTWHETMLSHRLWERLNYLERMVQLNIPCYAEQAGVEEDDEPEEASYTREVWKDYVEDFIVCDDWQRARELLAGQEKLSIKLLKQALADNAVDTKYSTQIIRLSRSTHPEWLANKVLMEVNGDIWAKYEESQAALVLRGDKIARAIQTMDNNAVILTANSKPFSRIISCAALDEAWRTKRTLIELVPLLECFAASHSEADEVITKFFIPADKKMINFYKEHNIDLPPPTDFATPRQVAHYILDWLIQIKYRLFQRKTPQQLAAVAWHIVDRRNPGLMLYGLETGSLAEYGGWPTSSGLCQLSQSLNIELERYMADPGILTISSLVDM